MRGSRERQLTLPLPPTPPVRVVQDPDHDGVLGLPEKFSSFKPHQPPVIAKISGMLSNGKRVVIARMPTGSGKTMVSMCVRSICEFRQTMYVPTTKSLQEQFLTDFPDSKLIKGRNNYPCGASLDKWPDITADDCTRAEHGKKCLGNCPYFISKQAALIAPVAVANMSYYLSETEHVGQFLGRDFVVADECDTLEDALLGHIEVSIRTDDIRQLKLGQPNFKTKWAEWRIWAESARAKVESELLRLDINEQYQDDWALAPLWLIRRKKWLDRMSGKLGFFLKYVDENWVWDRSDNRSWTFKPVKVDSFGERVFKTGKQWLLMSATIPSFEQFIRDVGLDDLRQQGLVGTVDLAGVFDTTRHPVRIGKGVDLTRDKKEENIPELVAQVRRILSRHQYQKGIIHSVTYDIAHILERELSSSHPGRVLTHSAGDRSAVIERFKKSEEPLVLVSPSISRGEDFPDEVCEFIVIVKLPFPYLGDPRVAKRLHAYRDGERWYVTKTIASLVQMTGRGMRHEGDMCVSYLLHANFRRLFLQNKAIFPEWWKESIVWVDEKSKSKSHPGHVHSRKAVRR